MPWHTATPKKIKYLVVVSGEATNYEKVFYLRTAPQYPHNYMEVVSAHLSNFAQPIGASGYKKTPPFPLSGSGGVSIVNQDSSADIHTAYPLLLDLDTLHQHFTSIINPEHPAIIVPSSSQKTF